jgi:hypothetical protein
LVAGQFLFCPGIVLDTARFTIHVEVAIRDVRTIKENILHAYATNSVPDNMLLKLFAAVQGVALQAIRMNMPPQHKLFPLQHLKRTERPWQTLIGNKGTNGWAGLQEEEFSAVWVELFPNEGGLDMRPLDSDRDEARKAGGPKPA